MSLLSRWSTTATNAAGITQNAKVASAAKSTADNLTKATGAVADKVNAKVTQDTKTAKTAASNSALASLNSQYTSTIAKARLAKFDYLTGDDDSSRRAYFKFDTTNGDTQALEGAVQGNTKRKSIIEALKNDAGFTNFILLTITENHQEKQQIISTINDYFALTFSGREPQIVAITGILPFDAGKSNTSWFYDYVDAYVHLFRASVLAKYKLQLKLILPDFSEYICYPISFSASIQSVQDGLVQFQMSAVVVQEEIKSATNVSSTAKAAVNSTASGAVKADENKAKSQQSDTTSKNDPKDVGTSSGKKNFLETATDFFNTCVTGQGTDKTAQSINKGLKVLGSINVGVGALEKVTGKSFGTVRNALKIFS